MMKWICLFLFPLYATAAPVLQGTLVSAGTSVNNLTTASAFTVSAPDPTSVQCDADVYLYLGSDNTTAATTANGLKIFADVEKVFTTTPKRNVIAILPVSGSANCKVFRLYGETISYRAPGGGGSGGTTIDPNQDILPRGVVAQAASGEYALDLVNTGARVRFGPSTAAICYFGGDNIVHCGNFDFSQVGTNQLNPTSPGASFVDLVSAGGLRMTPTGGLPTCAAFYERVLMVDNTAGASSGANTRICFCRSDGGGTPAYAWVNIVSNATGTAITCPA